MAEEQKTTTETTAPVQPATPPAQPPAGKIFPAVDEATGIQLRPRNFEELWKFAGMVAETEFVPASFRGKPGAVIAACQLGQEVGLPPMTALKWIAVINGTPSIWGDGYWMLLRSHPLCEYAEELSSAEAIEKGYGECTIKRKGAKPVTRRYTKEMAETAGLWGGKGSTEEKRKYSPWYTNPGRMLQMRARGLAGRDSIPEATGPLSMREEAQDFPAETDVTPAPETTAQPVPQPLSTPQPLATQEASDGLDEVGKDQGAALADGSDPDRSQLVEGSETTASASGTVGNEGASQVAAGKTKDAAPPALPTYHEREEWALGTATLEELSNNQNFALKEMKNLNREEQALICRIVNDRRQALLKEQKAKQ